MSAAADVLTGTELLESLYDDLDGALGRVVLEDVSLRNAGGGVTLNVRFLDFPGEPPERWVERGYNTVTAQIVCGEVESLSLEGWAADTRCSVRVSLTGGLKQLEVVGEHVRLTVRSADLGVMNARGDRLPEDTLRRVLRSEFAD